MRISVCITTFNESKNDLKKLLDALNNQTLKPDEIIVIDAKDYNNCSIAQGGNISIKKAKNEIIAITDVGCIPNKNWLEKITKPFAEDKDVLVAGFYLMLYRNAMQKAASIFLGVSPNKFDKDKFLPSARSVAFSKSIWKKVGGFNEDLEKGGEDSEFFYKCVKAGVKIIRTKEARVVWEEIGRLTFSDVVKKFYVYAKGDGEAGIWYHPTKQLSSHNIKISFIYIRYIIAFLLLIIGFNFPLAHFALLISVIFYLLYSFKKARLWGVILQLVSDITVMIGFVSGIMGKWISKKV
ncbi:MAG TPA: glycosyltransferase [Patescibacteria group bacterium]|nr:glycosyltransferase [Patescibacteria group bacterium]